MSAIWTGIVISVASTAIMSLGGFILWIRKADADRQRENALLDQRMQGYEKRLESLEESHEKHLEKIDGKMDQTIDILSDIKLAFAEVRIKNNNNEKRIERIESRLD